MRPTVRDVMTTDVATVRTDATFKEIARVLMTRQVSGLPVVAADGTVVGVVSEADLLPKEEFKSVIDERPNLPRRAAKVARAKAVGATAAELMSSPAVAIAPDAPVAEAARTLAEHDIKRLPVVVEGRLVGVVSRADVLKVFLKSDAEIGDLVMEEVVKRCLWEDPEFVTVDVENGIVTLGGTLQLKSLIPIAVRLTAAIDGVVDVVDKLTYERDDTTAESQRYWR
ncbi:MAG TPA: CBS domain-containing protein [Streptosporangiaceae bacterium]|nr:CBS domain-containing protein [Streptosporangiaceae bacterium]